MRHALGLDRVPGGVSPQGDDRIICDMRADGTSESGYGHALCGGKEAEVAARIGAGFMPNWKLGQP